MARSSRRGRLPATVGRPVGPSVDAMTRRALRPLLDRIRELAASVRSPADARRVARVLREEYTDARILEIVREIGEKIEAYASRPWAPLLRRAGFDARRRERPRLSPYAGRETLERWIVEAAALITSVRDEVADSLVAEAAAALTTGADPAALAARWLAQGVPVTWGTAEGRLKTIARHQVTLLHAQVQKARAQQFGVREFVWRTQGDGRVRDEHRELDGRVFSYDDPPSEGLPGEPVNCRCYAESVLPDDLDEVIAEIGNPFAAVPDDRPPAAVRRELSRRR